MKADPIITAFGPVANPRGNVIRLHRGVRPDPIDLRVNQLKLRVHPPIAWWEVAIMCVVAAFIGVLLATGGVL